LKSVALCGKTLSSALKRRLPKFIVTMSIFAWLGGSEVVDAGPFAKFFRELRESIAHPDRDARAPRKNRKRKEGSTRASSDSDRSRGASIGPPNRHNVRAAEVAPKTKEGKTDLRYGTPVPGKQGFVTNPDNPDGGYIDVRGISPGTKVKDPYTGKVILTP
jgi:hypothetical protein